MQLRFQEFDEFVVFFKPNGIRMHQVDEGHFGFVEAVSQKTGKPLFIVHRLDKETSGLVLFAKTKQAATLLSELFEDHLIQKTYFFLTDRPPKTKSMTARSHIARVQNAFISSNEHDPNSETQLDYVKPVNSFHLWKATPKTGKPHQIRLHAEASGIPILGDTEHGGAPWFRLCLHAASLQFTMHQHSHHFTCDLPPSFVNPDPLMTKNLFQDAFFNRTELFHWDKKLCVRLLHMESPNLRADLYGNHLWVYDYSPTGINQIQTDQIQNFANENHLDSSIRHMLDRGSGVGGLEKKTLTSLSQTAQWTARENEVSYVLKLDSGFSPGLFLDQRENRLWVREHSQNKRVLNLFSYTSGFSVAAALGGASQVTSVDTSKKFLEWSKENFQLNKIETEKHEFFAQDCLLFLKGAVKRGRQWDLIICDPPSFGRSQDTVWKIEKDIAALADLLCRCLAPQGHLVFTCNYERWTRPDLVHEFSKALPKGKAKIERLPLQGLDFGETDDTYNLTKGFLLTKL